jgi:hypothetical protein
VKAKHSHADIPLPPLDMNGQARERLLVRYDLLQTGSLGWLRITTANIPSSTPLQAYITERTPEGEWKLESDVEELEVDGLPAFRAALTGSWGEKDYVCETVAVRTGQTVYFMTASFLASDDGSREAVRQAIALATWQKSRREEPEQ